nr:unnamed protein product [Digitaria exilis]
MCPLFFFLAVIPLAFAALSPHASVAAVAARNNGSFTAGQPKVVTYQQQFLQAHNEAHTAAGVPPLVWNSTLQLDSLRYANELRQRCSTTPLYAWGTDGVYGRNLFKGSRMDIPGTPTEVVASWRWYHRRSNTCAAPDCRTCGGYTHVVWRATTQVGCARRRCRSSFDDTVAVCEYYPPGNIEGQRPY